MRNHVPMLAVLVLLGCNGPGVPDGGIWSKEPITGNGNKESPLTIEDKAISNEKLMNSGLTLMAGMGLTGGGAVALGGTTQFGVNFGAGPGTVAAGDDMRFAALRMDLDKVLAQLGQMPWGSYVQNGVAPQTADFNVTGSGVVGGGLTVSGRVGKDATSPGLEVTDPTNALLRLSTGKGRASAIQAWTIDGGNATFAAAINLFPIDDPANRGISFNTGGALDNATGRMFIMADGSVGVGTDAPRARLHVSGGQILLDNSRFLYGQTTMGQSLALIGVDSSNYLQVGPAQNGLGGIRFFPSQLSGEAVRMTSSGNIGIGTTSPDTHLHIAGTDAGGFVATLRLQNQNAGGADAFIGATDNNWAAGAGRLVIGLGSNHNSNDVKMTLLSNGNVGIATTSPATPLDVNGVVTCRGGCVNGSSRALKRDVADLSTADAVAAISALRPSRFAYKSAPNEPKLGFIAEDVPDLVAMNDRKSLDPMEFAALLTKVVQEQQKQIADQKRRIERLEAALSQQRK